MKSEDKKKVIEALDVIGRGLVDIAERLERIKTYIYEDESDKPLQSHNHEG